VSLAEPKPDKISGFFILEAYAMPHYVHILKSLIADKYYIGRTTNPDRRICFENTNV